MYRTRTRSNSHSRIALTLLAASGLVAPVLAAGCGRGQAHVATAKATPHVRVADVTLRSIARPIHATGLLAPKDEIALSFKIGGVIQSIQVEDGDAVRSGAVLASLDPREINAHVEQARSGLEKAERDLDRARRLYADSVATLEQVQDAETALDVARAGFEAVEFDLRHATIVAPSDGVILRRTAEPGELVSPGRPILAFGGTERGSTVKIGLADRDVIRIRRGDAATVRFQVDPERSIAGTVEEIAAAADPATGTFRVEVAIAEAGHLASGLVADVTILPAAEETLALIPVDALLEADGSQGSVYAVDASGARAERRNIEIAFLDGDRLAVRAGLEGVRQVIRDGGVRIDDGDSVAVMP